MTDNQIKSSKRWLMLFALCWGASFIYFLPYLRWSYYEPLQQALGLTHSQFGNLMTLYGFTALLTYWPGGWLADRFAPRKLLAIAFIGTGLGGFAYATFPSYNVCLMIHAFWGVTTTLTFWAAVIKATRDLAGSSEQGRFFGLLEGGRGLLQTLIAMGVVWLFTQAGEGIPGLKRVIYLYSIIGVLNGIFVWFILEDKERQDEPGSLFNNVSRVLKMPAVWLLSAVIFCNYACFIAQTNLTPYMTTFFGVSVSLSAVLAAVRIYGLQTLGGPIGGYISDKTGSRIKVVIACFVLLAISMGLFAFLPPSPALIWIVVANMLVFGASLFAMRGIYFALVDESGIPENMTGIAAGLASMIGFAPEVFAYSLAGHWMDKYPGIQGYKVTFGAATGVAVIGLLAAIQLFRVMNKAKTSKETNSQPEI